MTTKHLGVECENFASEKASWKELHSMRKQLGRAMKDLLSKLEQEKRDFRKDELEAYERCDKIIDRINAEFDLREEKNTRDPIPDEPVKTIKMEDKVFSMETKTETFSLKSNKRGWTELFPGDNNMAGYESAEHFLKTVAKRDIAPAEARTMQVKVGASGGYAVPTQLWNEMWASALEDSIMLTNAKVYPMQNTSLILPCYDNESRSTNIFGVNASFTEEASTATAQDLVLRTVTLTAKKFSIYTDISAELADDNGVGLANSIAQRIAEALRFQLDYECLMGAGVQGPQGIVNSPAMIAVDRAGANDIAFADVLNMWLKLHPAFRKSAFWVCSPGAENKMLQIKDGGNTVLWFPNGSVATTFNTLLNRPVYVSEKLPNVGTKGDLMLIAGDAYALGIRKDVTFDSTPYFRFKDDVISMRCILRLDGATLLDAPITMKNGQTASAYVVLN